MDDKVQLFKRLHRKVVPWKLKCLGEGVEQLFSVKEMAVSETPPLHTRTYFTDSYVVDLYVNFRSLGSSFNMPRH